LRQATFAAPGTNSQWSPVNGQKRMTLLDSRRVYSGKRINVDLDRVRFPDGSEGRLEMVRHPGASAVIPFLDPPESSAPRVILIRQYRWAAEAVMWEIPAGTLDAGEAPEQCARRELREEAGVTATHLRHLTSIYTTPGFTDEIIHLYAATGLTPEKTAHEPDEFIETHEVRWSEIGRMIRNGQIKDSKTINALMWVQCFVRQT
jgi:ADP-ribose pyrophosphatase